MTKEEWNSYLLIAARRWGDAPPGYRIGQHYFNVLHELHPEVANEIRATPCDPFYADDILPQFFLWVNAIYVEDQ